MAINSDVEQLLYLTNMLKDIFSTVDRTPILSFACKCIPSLVCMYCTVTYKAIAVDCDVASFASLNVVA